ncbi:HNH endonuclease [Steroidobacter sp. S1-65]|uniref:HNH endonuclease n=1 Tax=Steroidobacter gossypii TaxID=2805490 RepID=A0ABS1WXX9_9GAMM|nr:HIT domain-containing protein [Steroidobacter gossypii]MBM0105824.1 HNH endonuclease [Steroidobacter gossypii]
MHFDELLTFIERDMRMAHIYQPVMIRMLLDHGGRASREQIARALLNQDRSQLEYYTEIVRNMVGRVLTERRVVAKSDAYYELIGYDALGPSQIERLKEACDKKLDHFIARRGEAIWQHRRGGRGYISGTLRYEVLKRAKARCELCGIADEVRALQVDHIVPRAKGGGDDIANLQALCYICNAMKRDRDNTDFRDVRSAYAQREPTCPFCAGLPEPVLENRLARLVKDGFPVVPGHLLAIPKRHVSDYFELGSAEVRACQQLIEQGRELLMASDPLIEGFNVGINSGTVAGQTILHAHIHLIPRRRGDCPNPRGGVRAVIPGRADYSRDQSLSASATSDHRTSA